VTHRDPSATTWKPPKRVIVRDEKDERAAARETRKDTAIDSTSLPLVIHSKVGSTGGIAARSEAPFKSAISRRPTMMKSRGSIRSFAFAPTCLRSPQRVLRRHGGTCAFVSRIHAVIGVIAG